MNIDKEEHLIRFIESVLSEDIGKSDITTDTLIPAGITKRASIIAKANGVLCGVDVARKVFELVSKDLIFTPYLRDGNPLKKGTIIATIEGTARDILMAERTALNFMALMSGVATFTGKFVKAVAPNEVKIMDTRKTTPGLRLFQKYAVRVGGGGNHRLGLWHAVLIKENHQDIIEMKRTLAEYKDLIKKIRAKDPKIPIEIEVETLDEFKKAIKCGFDIIMLDDMTVEDIKKAVKLRNSMIDNKQLKKYVTLEVSGGINLKNIKQFAKTGIDWISIGALTHSFKNFDLSLLIK